MDKIKNGIRKAVKYTLYKLIFPCVYFLGAVRKIKSRKMVFVELHGSALSDNFQLLWKRLEQEEETFLKEYYLDYQKDSFSYYWRCFRLLWEISNASHIFLNDSCNVMGAFSLRRGSQMIQTWHACGAFKRWGFSVADREYGENLQEMEKYPYHKNYTLVTVSSNEVVWAYQEAFRVSEEIIKPLGVSRTDVYYQESFRTAALEKLCKYYPQSQGKKCILYAPTFRGTGGESVSPEVLDYEYLQKKLGENYIIIEKRHPFVKNNLQVPKGLQDFVIGDCQLTVEELICVADLCVTDYSSIVFEYAVMERPMVFLAYDLEQYFDNRGFYYEYQDFVPGPVVYRTEELLTAILELERQPEKAEESIRKFRQKFMSACDGHATERILQEVLRDG